ncbi:MAG: lipopolysaccharide biosynthesis protein RfbH [Patescibacteria group bacterium]
MDEIEKKLRWEISAKIEEIFNLRKKNKIFVPGKTRIQYAGGVFDDKEINASVSTLIDGWFGLGPKAEELETALAKYVGARGSILTNSGSSANLLVIASVMSDFFPDHLSPGDEVLTSACAFPTTVNPAVIYNLVPVFLDINPETYNVDVEELERAVSPRSRAVMLAHTLGNPYEMDKLVEFCKAHKLLLIEDNCDALGSEYDGKRTGSFGVLSTQSFYPAHHMTTGEGGAVNYSDLRFERITRSLRDWGRSCWCRGDEKRTLGACDARFNYRIGGKLSDHKYMYNQIGFNFKPTEAQAAMGVEQAKRLPQFFKKREENFSRFLGYAKQWEEYFILPKSLPKAKPSWFSFPLTIRDRACFERSEITVFLEERMIQTRPLFSGNLTKHHAYSKINYRQVGDLENSTRVLHNTFFLGVYPELGNAEIDFMAESINDFLKSKKLI